jgi:hypothetical protein
VASVAYSFQNELSVPAKAEQGVRAIQQQSNGSSQSEAEVSRTPIRWIRGIHGINVIRGTEIATHLSFTLIIKHLRMAEVLLSLVSRHGITQSLQREERTMRSAKRYAFGLGSKRYSSCEDLRLLHARSEAALRNARNLYRAAMKAPDSAALQNLEEELKQTSTAYRLVCYAVEAHLTNQHSQTRGVCLAA